MNVSWQFLDLGLIDLCEFMKIQDGVWGQRVRNDIPDTAIFAEHPITISLNERHRDRDGVHIRVPREELKRLGVAVVPVHRGGGVALHAPGILGCYIIKKTTKEALSFLGHVAQSVFSSFGVRTEVFPNPVASERCGKYFGAWVYDRKIATTGINILAGVSQFGINFNVSPEPELLRLIHPCGIEEYEMTSLALEGIPVTITDVKDAIQRIVSEEI